MLRQGIMKGIGLLKKPVGILLLCSMVAFATFQIMLKQFDPVSNQYLRLYLSVNAYYLGCLQGMQYVKVSKMASGSRCRILTEHYERETSRILLQGLDNAK